MRLRAALVAAAGAVTAIAAVTIGADSPTPSISQPSTTFTAVSYSPGATAGSTAATNPTAAGVALTAHDAAQVGPTVLDQSEHTLYRFDRDTASPSRSSCVDSCAETWPPVLVAAGDSVRLQGVTPSAVGTTVRADGALQLTLGGWPVYRYAEDRGPADLAGHGVGGTWFAVTPTGQKAPETDASRAAAASGRASTASSSRPGDRACPSSSPDDAATGVADSAGGLSSDTGGDVLRTLLGTERDSNEDNADRDADTDRADQSGKDGTDAPTAPATGRGELPSEVLDLSPWYLTLPTGAQGAPDTVEQPDLDQLANEHFKVNDTGDGVVFSAPGDGVTTKNSHFPRSELREMNGTEKAAWSNTSGTHVLEVCEAITEVPSAKPEVVAAQIHDGSDDVMQIRLEGKTLMVQYNDGKSEQVIDPNYTLGTPYNVRIVAADSKVEVLYNGAKKAELPLQGSGWYWKVGAYVQSNTEEGDGKASGAVTVYALDVSHQGQGKGGSGDGSASTGRKSDANADAKSDADKSSEEPDDKAEDKADAKADDPGSETTEKADGNVETSDGRSGEKSMTSSSSGSDSGY